MKNRWIVVAAAIAAAGATALPAAAVTPPLAPQPTVVYDNIPSPQPGNVPSVGFEATSTSEFGGLIRMATDNVKDPTITVLMSSWGCETGGWSTGDCSTTAGATFAEPITLNVYNVDSDDTVGSTITSVVKTFDIPYRPSADTTMCTGDNAGKWYSATDKACDNGLATPVTFNLTGVTLPSAVIVSVAYNTSNYGPSPHGTGTACYSTAAGCGYDSLNVGTADGPTTGAAPLPADAFLNSTWGGAYCDGGTSETGTFRLDAGCWTGYQPAFRVSAVVSDPPADKQACKEDGWQTLTRADGSTFKNQGNCIQYVNTGK